MLYFILILFEYWKHHNFFRRRACDSRNFLPFFSPFFVFLFYDSAFVSRRPSREPRLSKSNEVALAVHRYRTFDVMIRFTTIYSSTKLGDKYEPCIGRWVPMDLGAHQNVVLVEPYTHGKIRHFSKPGVPGFDHGEKQTTFPLGQGWGKPGRENLCLSPWLIPVSPY